jgi:hypothetical protein
MTTVETFKQDLFDVEKNLKFNIEELNMIIHSFSLVLSKSNPYCFLSGQVDNLGIMLTMNELTYVNGTKYFVVIRKEFGAFIDNELIRHRDTDEPADINYTSYGKLKHIFYCMFGTAFREHNKPYHIRYNNDFNFEQYSRSEHKINLRSLERNKDNTIRNVIFRVNEHDIALSNIAVVCERLKSMDEADFHNIHNIVHDDEINLILMTAI